MGRTMRPDPGDQIAYDLGNVLAGDRFEHVGLDSVDRRGITLPSLLALAAVAIVWSYPCRAHPE